MQVKANPAARVAETIYMHAHSCSPSTVPHHQGFSMCNMCHTPRQATQRPSERRARAAQRAVWGTPGRADCARRGRPFAGLQRHCLRAGSREWCWPDLASAALTWRPARRRLTAHASASRRGSKTWPAERCPGALPARTRWSIQHCVVRRERGHQQKICNAKTALVGAQQMSRWCVPS